jgi:Exostosin family
MIKIFISCCKTDVASEEILLRRLVQVSHVSGIVLVDDPETANLILVVDIKEANVFQNLRENNIWRLYPQHSFGYYEGDNPPAILHGVYSSATRTKGLLGRMQSTGYPFAEYWLPNLPQCGNLAFSDEKKYLMNFTGRRSHAIRKTLFKLNLQESLIIDTTKSYYHFSKILIDNNEMQRQYWMRLNASKFALCPCGAGSSSIRLFQAMSIGVAPVIISDSWIPPIGPKWHEFALFLPESRIFYIYEFIKFYEHEHESRGRAAKLAFEEYFSHPKILDQIFKSIDKIKTAQQINEKYITYLSPFIILLEWFYQTVYILMINIKNGVKYFLNS